MANRHKKAKSGVGSAAVSYGNSDVVKEAREKKDGGRVAGRAAGGRMDKRARGGAVKRASGGRASATKSPYSSAAAPSDKSNPPGGSIPRLP
jgi:hypothetical protein